MGHSSGLRLRQQLATWAGEDLEQIYLDVKGLRYEEGITAENPRSLIGFAPHVRLHVVGAAADLR
ncbi:hypothetical protein B7767_33545 [Streptomyces sp. 13-12-16]|nr:hypothetical protein B7767_33545 [Streptomyces sp. 13-12-16]